MTHDENIQRNIKIWIVVVIFLFFFLAIVAGAKDLPIDIKISELGTEFHEKRVAISGHILDFEVAQGRLGSTYLKFIIVQGDHEIIVYSIEPITRIKGDLFIAQGIYHESGRFGGSLAEGPFIVAEVTAMAFDYE